MLESRNHKKNSEEPTKLSNSLDDFFHDEKILP